MDAFRLFDVVDIQKRVVAYVVAVYVYKIASESLAFRNRDPVKYF